MKCIIIDDEPLALGIINSYCEEIGGIQVVGLFTNPLEAFDFMRREKIDLVFLDIEMPQINGIDFIKTLDTKPYFIFTTAYAEYAIEGFELNASDYLVKPIPFMRFVKSVNRVKEMHELRNRTKDHSNLIPAGSTMEVDPKFVFVKSEYDNVKIKLDEIKYIQGLKDYLKIHLIVGKPILTLMNFKSIEEKLTGNNFVRVHRSFLININSIRAVQRSKIIIDDTRIPIGESYKDEFMRRIGIN